MLIHEQPAVILQSQDILNSFRLRLGRELIERSGDPLEESRRLFDAACVVVAHGTEADPVLNYGNAMALKLWEVDWSTLCQMPSRLTAEPVHRDERARMLETTQRQGYMDDYAGIRISATGKRFRIERAIVWNLIDATGDPVGQAATFQGWVPL